MRSGNDDEDEDDDDEHFQVYTITASNNMSQASSCSALTLCRIHQCDTAWVGQRLQSSGFPSWRRGGPEGSLVMNQYVQLLVQTFSPPVQLY